MNEKVISVESVSKQYRLGRVGTGTLSHDLNRWWHVMRGKSDPYLKIGEENDRSRRANSQYIWALTNISFDVTKGEILGIIGKNGAGKSTLLKILSRTTSPTAGSIKIKGRVASLLEIGTGFHPELTGRENIFLNGAILGMSKNEIRRKFDEIVDFSGVERYIDTPVKRYSSGMYVRLAFGVAAHLEPEILIVDEVLAVGDIEFQKKCLGKMDEVAHKGGRTVLFVSHNMAAIRSLCNRAILLKNGNIEIAGKTEDVASHYLKGSNETSGLFDVGSYSEKEKVIFQKVVLRNQHGKITQDFHIGDDLVIELHFYSSHKIERPYFMIGIKSKWGSICGANGLIDGCQPAIVEGEGMVKCIFNKLPFLPQQYTVSAGLRASDGKTSLSLSKDIAYFNILTKLSDVGFNGLLADTLAPDSAPVLLPYVWQFGGDQPIEVDISKYARPSR
jgi:lipopolysaccharide transport system ATP-binding protein